MNNIQRPPQGNSYPGTPPSYALVSRMRKNVRPAVLATTFAAGFWALIWGIGSFQDVGVDANASHKLGTLSVVLGIMYMVVLAIELLGFGSALIQRLLLIRAYAYLSILAALIVIATGFIRTIIHFMFKNQLIQTCITLSTGQTVDFSFGIWGPVSSTTLSPDEATNYCNNAFSHDSFSEIVMLLIVLLLAPMFSAIAFSYLRQMRAPSNQVRSRMGFPDHYNPAYAAPSVPNFDYNAPQYAPPPGAPPRRNSDEFVPPYEGKLPGYGVGIGADDDKSKFIEGDGKDPFADFDGPSGQSERDAAGRPGYGV